MANTSQSETESGDELQDDYFERLPVDLWRNILRYVAPSDLIQHFCRVSKQFKTLCDEPKAYENLVCRFKCFSTSPIVIDDALCTISVSVYDEYNRYFQKFAFRADDIVASEDTQSSGSVDLHQRFKLWLRRLSKCKYLDLGSFPLDEEYVINVPLKTTIQQIVHRHEELTALHFDGFYSDDVKLWFLAHIVENLSPQIKHISLRWDKWNIAELQKITTFRKLFNHFWMSIDGRSHMFHLPLDLTFYRQREDMKLDNIRILALYRLYFGPNMLQSLLNATCHLQILYMFASSWDFADEQNNNDGSDRIKRVLILPAGLRSLSLLLSDGNISLKECCNDLRHITIDSPTNSVGTSIIQQLVLGNNTYLNLKQFNICFWAGISDSCPDIRPENEIEFIVNLIVSIHQNGKTKKFDSLALSCDQAETQSKLQRDLMEALKNLYGEKYVFKVSNSNESISATANVILDDADDIKLVQDIARRKFGLIRNI